MSAETWVPVVGYEGLYEVSDLGSVRSLPRVDAQGGRRKMRLHKPSRMDLRGHLGVKLRRDGAVKSLYVHRLVLEAFVGPCPPGQVACHWNDVPADNRLTNLRWASQGDNRLDCVRNGGDYNANKTACWRGHPFDATNTRTYDGRRHCRACQRINEANYKARRRARSTETAAA